MSKEKCFIMIMFISIFLLFLPNFSSAAEINVTRDVYSDNCSMKFTFTGLTLDKTHEYEYGLTKTAAETVTNWYLITDFTTSTATVDIITTTRALREVVNTVDTGYITIKDKTSNNIILQPFSVDLKLPYLKISNYTVIPNGKMLSISDPIKIALRNANNSTPYYQYEKVTDQNLINKYKEIKSKNGDFSDLESMLTLNVPQSNWTTWDFWNGYDSTGMDGLGYPENEISVPDTGLYYMWIFISGSNLKNLYGCILVDNLQPEIALESISLPETQKVELGKKLTLTPVFNPSTATNKMVTWSSSDETVATIDNGGTIIPKKVGSTIITVKSQDSNKIATCTVTVVESSKGTDDNNSPANSESTSGSKALNSGSPSTSTGSSNNKKNDTTVATGKLPQTGAGVGLVFTIVSLVGISVFTFIKYNKYRGV